jgi:hypothetical protein
MVKFPSFNNPGFRSVIGILQEFRDTLVLQRAEQHPQDVPSAYGHRLLPEAFSPSFPISTSATNPFEHARPDFIPNDGSHMEAETCDYALSVDVLGFLKSGPFREDDQDLPQISQCSVSSFLRGGIQPFVKEMATIDDNNGGQTTSGYDTQSPSPLRLLWVHVPINNTKWVHVCSPITAQGVEY